jgi:hypothetical protein
LIILLHDGQRLGQSWESSPVIHKQAIGDGLTDEYRNKFRIRPLRGRLQTAGFGFVISGVANHRGGSRIRDFCEKVNPSAGRQLG